MKLKQIRIMYDPMAGMVALVHFISGRFSEKLDRTDDFIHCMVQFLLDGETAISLKRRWLNRIVRFFGGAPKIKTTINGPGGKQYIIHIQEVKLKKKPEPKEEVGGFQPTDEVDQTQPPQEEE